jgi:hypothetical protein
MPDRKSSKRGALIVAHRSAVPDPIDRARMTQEVIALRRLMTPWREIGQEIGVAPSTALGWYKEALAGEVDHQDRAAALVVELDALNVIQGAWWARATGGCLDADGLPVLDEKAANIVLKVMAQRARLMGLDAPIVIDPGDPVEVVAAAIVAHLARRSELV